MRTCNREFNGESCVFLLSPYFVNVCILCYLQKSSPHRSPFSQMRTHVYPFRDIRSIERLPLANLCVHDCVLTQKFSASIPIYVSDKQESFSWITTSMEKFSLQKYVRFFHLEPNQIQTSKSPIVPSSPSPSPRITCMLSSTTHKFA